MRHVQVLMALVSVLTFGGCATAQSPTWPDSRLRFDEVVALSQQGLGDEALIAEIEQRGIVFVLSPRDSEQQRAAGVSEGLLRYLQGRARGEQELRTQIVAGRYWRDAYAGPRYLGYNYLGYYDGLHYYGGYRAHRHVRHAGNHHDGHGHHGGRRH